MSEFHEDVMDRCDQSYSLETIDQSGGCCLIRYNLIDLENNPMGAVMMTNRVSKYAENHIMNICKVIIWKPKCDGRTDGQMEKANRYASS